jgi:hypothetical protein
MSYIDIVIKVAMAMSLDAQRQRRKRILALIISFIVLAWLVYNIK